MAIRDAELDLSTFLAAQGLGLTSGTNLFAGPLPDAAADRCVVCRYVGGQDGEDYMGNAGAVFAPEVQVLVRGDRDRYAETSTLANTCFQALYNPTIPEYVSVKPVGAAPNYMGADEKGRHRFTFTIECRYKAATTPGTIAPLQQQGDLSITGDLNLAGTGTIHFADGTSLATAPAGATDTAPGLVTTAAQVFAGRKTFNDGVTLGAKLSLTGFGGGHGENIFELPSGDVATYPNNGSRIAWSDGAYFERYGTTAIRFVGVGGTGMTLWNATSTTGIGDNTTARITFEPAGTANKGGAVHLVGRSSVDQYAIGVILNTDRAQTVAGALIADFRNGNVSKATVDKDGYGRFPRVYSSLGYFDTIAPYSGQAPVQIYGTQADGSTAIGVKLGTQNTWLNAAAKLVQIVNANGEKAYVDKDGGYRIGTGFGIGVGGYAFGNSAGKAVNSAGWALANGDVAHQFDATWAAGNTGKLMRWVVGGAEKAYLSDAGALFPAVGMAAQTDAVTLPGGAYLNTGVSVSGVPIRIWGDATWGLRITTRARIEGALTCTSLSTSSYQSSNAGAPFQFYSDHKPTAASGNGAFDLYAHNTGGMENTAALVTFSYENAGVQHVAKVLKNGDVESLVPGAGLILPSPNGTRYRITVSDTGTLTTAPA